MSELQIWKRICPWVHYVEETYFKMCCSLEDACLFLIQLIKSLICGVVFSIVISYTP